MVCIHWIFVSAVFFMLSMCAIAHWHCWISWYINGSVCVYFIVLLTFIITVCWILELVELLFLVLAVPFFLVRSEFATFSWWGLSVVLIARLVTWFVCGIPVRVSSDVFVFFCYYSFTGSG